MFLNTTSTTHPARKSLDPRRTARASRLGGEGGLIEQARRIRVGHISLVLGITVAVAAAASLGALQVRYFAAPSTALPARCLNGIAVS